jgi:protein gp37
MSEKSAIEWTDHTFNPWWGCTKVSQGCKHCYAETLSNRFGKAEWGPSGVRIKTSAANWKQPLKWNRQAKENGTRYRVFCASMADVFEDKLDQPELNDWRRELFQLIINTPHLDWQLLTKRPENVNRMIERATGFGDSEMWFHAARNVWIGTSVENQETADERIPHLLHIPAAVRFLSVEPLLGAVDLGLAGTVPSDISPQYRLVGSMIHWVIVGGESGRGARPMHPDWVRSIRDQCNEAGVPFFFKQWGGANKKKTGRLLDGREWDEFPEVQQ